MAIVVGIDEAGFGPTLGPLVVSSAAFGLPDELLNCSLWKLLAAQLTQRRLKNSPKLHVNDSKKVFIHRRH